MKKNVLDFTDINACVVDEVLEFLGRKVNQLLVSHLTGMMNSLEYQETIIKNFHFYEFFLKSLTLEDVPNHGRIHFVCNSWVYPASKYKSDRIFFANQYRENELVTLRGDGTGKLEEWELAYDYAYYNDLGYPDKGEEFARPILGGSSEYPYPRRDPNSESRIPLLTNLDIYVPRDERFGHVKMSDFLAFSLNHQQSLLPGFKGLLNNTPNEFDSFEDVYSSTQLLRLFKRIKLHGGRMKNLGEKCWRNQSCLNQEFPPKSKLDPNIYGNQNSTITREQIEDKLDGLTVDEAIKANMLFILNHHDIVMPYLRRINTTTYASRTLLFLQHNGTLKPLAIELSLPHPDGDHFGTVSKVIYTADQGVEGSIWQLAKAYAVVNDTGIHQLISHWLKTHAVIGAIVIATNRQLSVLHPIHKLLLPHFRDTMNINALARKLLINSGGIIELTFFPAKYSMEMSAVVYKDWIFPEQALPADLIKRITAYAVDGLKIWSAIRSWVTEYCYFYYKSDDTVQKDSELQDWWKELRREGHGDKKDEPWWPKMKTRQELIESCTIAIWIASALHAAVNFGQYAYAGYSVNRSSLPKVHARTRKSRRSCQGMLQIHFTLDVRISLQNGQRSRTTLALERFGKKEDIEDQIMQMNGKERKGKLGCSTHLEMRITQLKSNCNQGFLVNQEVELKRFEESDRVYDYAYYNDLGDPEKGSNYVRPILGGSSKYPYPRRGRTGRPPTKTGYSFLHQNLYEACLYCWQKKRYHLSMSDFLKLWPDPNSESRLPLLMSLAFMSKDEKFAPLKMTDFIGIALHIIAQPLSPSSSL
ncbi:Arachidonate 5-lipoxygenase [Datura stramonium]|uniref:Lipoxygenase n=1 Tax=Datura stramonium TaxID=4076 RepID=A0ABS8RIF3_DATST|nr:Arachidonate 5-lipoxygenase [Datura stramonium]